MRAALDALGDQSWVADHETGSSRLHYAEQWVDVLDVARAVFGTNEPSNAEQRSLRRALRSLADRGEVELRVDSRRVDVRMPGYRAPQLRRALVVRAI